ncbi:pilus (MSHA type) biogenesis protein MshL [Oceanimonas smirnovii]|uniref:pilus (MSHA type) biogenesis protein MshL n=1 Tax=Oceanimonas smirnovii TaxID=264574 RepID=UPI000382CC62|nr:pilus (MSHA type) biogenesis protein MshL [Oceanimonas smirnovii]
MKRMLKPLTLALVAAGLTACVQTPDGSLPKQALDEALQTRPDAVPAVVEQELLSSRRPAAGTSLAPARRFDIAARDVDAREFFAALGSQHNVSIAVHPDVTGTITLNLRRVTLPEILDAISGLYGYGIEQRSGVYQVYANGVRSRTFNVNYLMLSRNGQSQTAISGSSLGSSDEDSNTGGSSTRINTESNNDFWSDLESALGRLIGNEEGRVVVTNPQAGLVTVRAAPDELALVDDFLTRAERQLKRQVILEARIVEVELNDGYEQGIEWNNLSANSRSGQVATGNTAVTYPGFLSPLSDLLGGGAVFTYTDGNFDAVVNLLQTQGEVNTLSNPRVTTSNNQKAVIKVGTDEYFVTDFSIETETNNDGSTNRIYPEPKYKPFFSGISLDVTPQIGEDNRILLHIHPAVVEVEEDLKLLPLDNNVTIPLNFAKSTVRESDTVVEAASGEVIIIGGLMQEKQTEQETAIPLISEIPVLGNLFKNRNLATQKSELVIMLRPVVVAANTWQTELQRSRDLLEKWYPPQPETVPLSQEYRGAR